MITVNARELKALIDSNSKLALLNVRPAVTSQGMRIPKSRHIPQSELKEKIEGLLTDKSCAVAVYGTDLTCESSTRSADILEKLGYSNVYNFTAGLKGWTDEGYKVETPPFRV